MSKLRHPSADTGAATCSPSEPAAGNPDRSPAVLARSD